MQIKGMTLAELREMPDDDIDALLAFGRPITFRMGSADILAEFNACENTLQVNLGHIDEGGEGVLLRLWKLIETYARRRGFSSIDWNVHALTCANPNLRLQQFLRDRDFVERDDGRHGPVLHLIQPL